MLEFTNLHIVLFEWTFGEKSFIEQTTSDRVSDVAAFHAPALMTFTFHVSVLTDDTS